MIKQAEAGLLIRALCRKGGFSDATFTTDVPSTVAWRCPMQDARVNWRRKNDKLNKLLAEAHLDTHALDTACGVKR